MQIPSTQVSATRLGSDVAPAAARNTTRSSEEPGRAAVGQDQVELSSNPNVQDPATRLAGFGERVAERLAAIEQEGAGVDLSTAQAALASGLERLQAGIADGTLSGEDLTRGVQNALAIVGGEVRSALGMDDTAAAEESPGAPTGHTPEERLAMLEESVNSRIGAIAQGAEPETVAQLREAQQAFAGHLERVRGGLSDGSLAVDELTRGMRMSFEYLSENLAAAVSQPVEDPASATGASVQERIAGFQNQVSDRLASLMSGAEGGTKAPGHDFDKLMQRLSDANEHGQLGDDKLVALFQRAVSGLASELSAMRPQGAGDAYMYDAKGQLDPA